MKIAIIGNSHIAALKLAWTEIAPDFPQHQIVFFGHRGNKIANLIEKEERLVGKDPGLRKAMKFTSGGVGAINPKDYDLFLVHGVGLDALFLPEGRFFTSKFIAGAAHEIGTRAPAMKIINLIRSLSKKPVYVGHMPLPVASEVRGDQSTAAFVNGMAFLEEKMFAPLDAKLVLQPLETIVNGESTERRFKQNSTSLAIGDSWDNHNHRDTDRRHMNAEFGKLWLNQFFGRI
ncbi:hypothetical protein [Rhizobium sp. FKL33]|uniref:hypothetical protein n=1 Tax=Rhizobium sp. FKL33 TaxID=2562307 RepID=UPI0010BFE55E|nr:hypothetical protein [Rhizobium sp. FKL33]